MVKRKKNGVNKADLDRLRRKFPSLGTALARNTKHALKQHGQEWFRRMASQFRAPLVPYGRVNRNPTLHTRTGFLKNSLRWRVVGTRLKSLGLEMRSDHPGARTQEYGGRITARSRKYLAIPIDDNLTPAGARRWSSPLDPEIIDGFFLEVGGNLYYVRKTKRTKNKRTQVESTEDLQFLFAMRKSVDIPGPKSVKRRQPSRLGFRKNAVGPGPRKALRRKLVLSIKRSVNEATTGRKDGGTVRGGGLAGPKGPLPG